MAAMIRWSSCLINSGYRCVAEADREACAANEQGQEVRGRGKNKFEGEEHEERWRRMRL